MSTDQGNSTNDRNESRGTHSGGLPMSVARQQITTMLSVRQMQIQWAAVMNFEIFSSSASRSICCEALRCWKNEMQAEEDLHVF